MIRGSRICRFGASVALVCSLSFVAATSHGTRSADGAPDPWAKLPFTAREWARQALLPYRQIPLKDGGTISVQRAYDLYLNAGQPDYPDMATPGLVTEQELEEQVRLSKIVNSQTGVGRKP